MRRSLFHVLVVGITISSAPASAGLFSSRFDDFKEFVEGGKVDAALALMAAEPDYFAKLDGRKREYALGVLGQQFSEREKRGDDAVTLGWLSVHGALFRNMAAESTPAYQQPLAAVSVRTCGLLRSTGFVLDKADQEPAVLRRWALLKRGLPAVDRALKTANLLPAPAACPEPQVQGLTQAAQRIRAQLSRDARSAFMSYGPFSEPAFDEQYPLKPDMAQLVDANPELDEMVRNARMPALRRYAGMYLSDLPLPQRRQLSARYLDELARERGLVSFADKTRLAQEIGKQGFTAPTLQDRVLVAYWAPPKADEGQPFTVREGKADVAFQRLEEQQTPLQFLHSGAARGRDLVVFLRFTPLRAERDTRAATQVTSNYRTGTRRVPNPEHAKALQEAREAERQAREAERLETQSASDTSSTLGILSAVTGAMTSAYARSSYESAVARLEEIPQEIDEAILAPYSYKRTQVAARKVVNMHYAAYDMGTDQLKTGTAQASLAREFVVLEGVRADDPNHLAILGSGVTAHKVDEFLGSGLWDDHAGLWAKLAEAKLQ